MKKIILFILPIFTAIFLTITPSYAQTTGSLSPEEESKMRQMAKELGVTFPIADLGNCAGPAECRDYCSQQSNYEACTSFAKKHGFSKKEDQSQSQKKDELLQKAKEELGCNSVESCSQICEQNREKCEQFARRHGYHQEDSNAKEHQEKQNQLVEKAHSELGCNSQESCSSYCQQEQNKERCRQFTQRHQTGQDETRHGEDNTGPTRPTSPGGCRTEEECRRYYQEQRPNTTTYPQPTGGYNYPSPSSYQNSPTGTEETTPQPTHDPSTSCTSYPGCSWTGTTCDCSERVQGASTESKYEFHFQYLIEYQP